MVRITLEFSICGRLRFSWSDERLKYNGSDYFDDWDSFMDSVNVYTGPGGDIWYPDVALKNGPFSNIDEVSNFPFRSGLTSRRNSIIRLRAQIYDELFLETFGWNVHWSRMLVLNSTY